MRKSKLRGAHWLIQVSWKTLLSVNSVLPTMSHLLPTSPSVNLGPSFSLAPIDSLISSGMSTPFTQESIFPGIRFWIVVISIRQFKGKALDDSVEGLFGWDGSMWWCHKLRDHSAAETQHCQTHEAPWACFDCTLRSSPSCGYCGFGIQSFTDDR